MKSKRIQWLDFAKGFTILFVIITHVILNNGTNHFENNLDTILVYYINTFIMPLFFAISGYLYKRINTIHNFFLMLYKKLISLLIPYFVFTIIFIIHYKLSINIFLQPFGYLWFLYALFFMFIIVGLMDLFRIRPLTQLIIYFVLSFLQMLLPWWNNGNIRLIPSIFGYIFFFYLGYIIHRFNLIRKMLCVNNGWLGFLILILGLIIFIQMKMTGSLFNTDRVYYNDIFTKIMSLILILPIFSRLRHNIIFKHFTKYGKYTLVIYLIHFPIKNIISHHLLIIHLLQRNATLASFVIILVTYILSLIFCYFVKKVTILNFVFYPRKNYISKLVAKTKWGKWLFEK